MYDCVMCTLYLSCRSLFHRLVLVTNIFIIKRTVYVILSEPQFKCVKGTESVILSDTPCKDGDARYQTVPLYVRREQRCLCLNLV